MLRDGFARLGLTCAVAAFLLVGQGGETARAETDVPHRAEVSKPLLFLISIDGFRWDYLDIHRPQMLRKLAKEGVHARRMNPSFPSKTFPNHYTIVTGLRPAHHGIVSNDMFDPEWQAVFHIGAHPSARESRWWEGEPIWATAERQGRTTACYFWPGSDARIGEHQPTYWKKYVHHTPIDDRIAGVLQWLDLPEPERPELITLYFHHVDSAGHDFGPRSRETKRAVRLIDAAIASLLEGLRIRGLDTRADLVIVSDHGMTSVSPKRVIYLDDFIDPDQVHVDFEGTVAGLRPYDMTPTELRERFSRDPHPHLRAYLVDELPQRFHYSGHRRIPPVILLPDVGWEVATRATVATWNPATMKGAHGYDPDAPDMGALFLAHGPSFQKAKQIGTVENVDVYNLLCAILDVTPAPNDGDWSLANAALIGAP